MHLFQKTFCSTKRRKAVVKMNTNEKISRKGVVIVFEIQLILSLFFTKYKQRFYFGTTQVGFDLKHYVIATSNFL